MMRTWWRTGVLLLLLVTSPSLWAHALPVVDVDDKELVILDSRLSLFLDPSARMTINDVVVKQHQGKLYPAQQKDLAPGYTRNAIWVAVRLRNATPVTQTRFIEVSPPRLRDIRLFMPGQEGWTVMTSGISMPVDRRPVHSRQPVFPLELAPGEVRDIFIRISSGNAVMISVRLWQPEAFHADERKVDLVNGIQFGAIFLFSLYSLLLFFSTRDQVFLFFFISMAAYGFYDVAILQYGFEFLWPGQTEWSMRSPGVFLAAAVASTAMLISRLLQTERHFPVQGRIMLVLALISVMLVPLQLLLPYDRVVPLTNLLALVLVVFSLTITVLAVWRRQRNAVWMMFAFVLLWFTSLLRIVQIFGLVPHDLWVDYAQSWSMVLSGAILAGVIADIVRQLRIERTQAREAVLTEREQSAQRLEHEVESRTLELVEAKERAEEASRAKSTFLAHMSHELRTPLHSILGYSRLAMDSALSAVDRKRLEAVQRSGRHLLSLIDELLDYARGEAGRLRLELRPVYLQALLESAVEDALPLAQAAGADLHAVLDPALPPVVLVDAVRLQQVLANLLSNACHHSQASRISLEVRRLPERNGSPDSVTLWFGVRDNGTGIPAEAQVRIFSPFEQVEATVTSRGVGLGLPIAHQLVALMDGELQCESDTNGGSLFSFTITLALADESALVPVAGPLGLHRYEGRIRRILVVDDIPENRALLADILASAGFDLALAGSGEEALARLASEAFDAVIIDQFMPGLSGWQVLRRARERNVSLPFLLLSATRPMPPVDWPIHLVFSAVLIKPVDQDALLKTLGRVLGLTWGAEDTMPRHACLKPPQFWVKPSAELLLPLREALDLGQVTDIEEWVDQLLLAHPESAEFAQLVRDAVRRLDFAFIRRLLDA